MSASGSDRPRYLAPKLGYTPVSTRAIDQLECVDEAEQDRQSALARRRERERQQQARQDGRRRIVDGIQVAKMAHLPRVRSSLRAIERTVARIDRHLAAPPD